MKGALLLLSAAGIANGNVLRSTNVAKAPVLDLGAGKTCSDPPAGLPGYCCDGIVPAKDFADSCECNPGWTHKECICKGYLTQLPCHHCMVHLPATNRWLTSFSEKELYDNCDACVTSCKAEFEADGAQCKDFIGDVFTNAFPNNAADPEKVICTAGFLKSQVMQKDYPQNMKRSLYKNPTFSADNEYNQPSDWKVAGVR